MPPRRRAAAAAPPADPPLDGCAIAISGKFDSISHHSHGSLETLIRKHGGTVTRSVTKATTHVVCTEDDFAAGTTKIVTGKAKDLPVVGPQWLLDVDAQNKKLSADDYAWKDKQANDTNGKASANVISKKRSAKADKTEVEDEEEEEEEQPKTKKAKGTKTAAPKTATPKTAKAAKGTKAKAAVKDEPEESFKEEKAVAEGQFVKKGVMVPIDEHCPYTNWQVYVDPDSGMCYDGSLSQANATNNNNKFYRIQVQFNPGTKQYHTWTRWGRVGETGQNGIVGSGSLADAIKGFEKKFKDKSGLTWENRGDNPKPGKYAFVERSYNPDSDDEDDTGDVKKEDDEDELPAPECTLEKPIQDLMELIFNQQLFQATMASLNYDANKLPLGKLSKATITRGFQQLKDLAALFDDSNLAISKYNTSLAAAVENLSNTYYSVIPHDFGRQRPPVIRDETLLKKEVELLESLTDMKEAVFLMREKKTKDTIHQLDRQFQGLGLEEMTTLDHESKEFKELAKYLNESRGSTHPINYDIQEIFRIERQGEADRFNNSPYANIKSDRRLLWHGSRVTNFAGIISQGLRIAPPEAPVSGYMFGKGIYLADMSSKSAGYCAHYTSNRNALLLLCEAELGDPMQELVNASYNAGEDAKRNGMHSTWGQGNTGPSKWVDASIAHKSLKGIKMPDTKVKPGPTNVPGAGLFYNEYIAYDVAQVKLRYLFRVKM